MNLVRAGAALAAVCVHAGLLGLLYFGARQEPDLAALQAGEGKDELSVVATITMQSEASLGLDAASAPRREDSAGGQAAPQVKEAALKEEEKVELPHDEKLAPAPFEEKEPEKKVAERQPSNPAPSSEAVEESHAASRAFEARRSQAISVYNSAIYQALMRNAIRPKTMERGRVLLELTLSPSGALLERRVVQSSGSPALDKTALMTLERAAPFPPVPPEAGAVPHTLRVPFEYAVK